jgi:UPF0176 protein
MSMSNVTVAAVYQFARLDDLVTLQPLLRALLVQHQLLGTLLIAHEGINGTIAGARADLDRGLEAIRHAAALGPLDVKWSTAARQPFRRAKVRIKQEIVSMGVADIDPLAAVGTYVEPHEWNALIADPNVVLVDARNHYEVRIGTFPTASDPKTNSFRELPAYLDQVRADYPNRKIAMFCTGGIRCEKASAYLRANGHDDVYHLRGGILRYLEQVPAAESAFIGSCFVFDERVAVDTGLALTDVTMCEPCGAPLTAEDRASYTEQLGKHCIYCATATTTAPELDC